MASSDTVAGDRDGALTEGVVSKTDEAEHQELSLRQAAGGFLSRMWGSGGERFSWAAPA